MNLSLISEEFQNLSKILRRYSPVIEKHIAKRIIRIGTATASVLIILSVQCVFALPLKSPPIDKVEIKVGLNNETLIQAFRKVEAQSSFHFMYRNEEVENIRNLNLPVSKTSVEEFLKVVLAKTSLTYKQINDQILIIPVKVSSPELAPSDFKLSFTINANIVNGKVTNSKGDPLAGVSVTVKGAGTGTSTDEKGNYSVTVPEQAVLVFSYVGYAEQEVTVGSRSSINVTLAPLAESMDQIVVTALGIKREARSLTYSTQSVNVKQLTEARELNVMNSLEGKVPGLSMNSSGTGLGADVRVVLRGDRSISGDSQPLYVIDGVPVRGNPSNLSPDNIASMSVLKGPNAAALYGSAAANGAIVIETKRGRTGVNLSLNNTYQVLEPIQYIDYQYQYAQGNGGVYEKSSEAAWGPKMEGQMVDTWSLDPAQAGTQYALLPQIHNKDDIFKRGNSLASSLLASIGGEKTQSVLSYTFTNANGIIPTNALQRHNLSLRINSKLTDHLSLDTKVDYMRQKIDNSIDDGRSNFNTIRQIYRMPPNIRSEDVEHYEFTDANGLLKQNWWNPATTTGSNPYWMMNRAPKQNILERIIAMTSLSYDFSGGFKLMGRASYDGDNGSTDVKYYNNTFTRAVFGRYTVSNNHDALFNSDVLLSYTKKLSSKWNVGANLGGSIEKRTNSILSANTGTALLVPDFFTLSNSTMDLASYDPGNNIETHALYAFGNLSYLNAIFLDVTGRNDWSSTLPAKNRSYFYPSVGLSAVLSDLLSLPAFFSFAKVRASYAKVGNSAPPYMGGRTATFKAGGNNGYLSLSNTLPNPNLLPEQTESVEFGADLSFFNGRLGLNATYYNTDTRNQLFTVVLPVGSGASQFFTNGGDVRNNGIELLLSTTPIKTRSFKWDLNFTFASNHNMVLKISDERPKVIMAAPGDPYFKDVVIQEGRPFGELFSRGFVRDEDGNVIVGSDGLPQVTPGRTVYIGNAHPKWQGGVSSSFSYKNFNLTFLIDHRQGGVMSSMTNAMLAGDGILGSTVQGREGGLVFGSNFFTADKAVLQDGKPNDIAINAETFWKRMGGESSPIGEVFTYSATNTRLREVTVGYTLSKSLVDKIGVANIRFSLVGRNLLFLYRASKNLEPDTVVGTDPSAPGFSEFAPPTTRSFGASLLIDFK